MSPHQFDIQLVAIIVAASCAVPGTFLVLRRMSMMTDAISHSILLGIILAFFIIKDLSSPFLIIGAAASGVLAISLVEAVNRARLVKKDASIAMVYPFLFSVAVILLSRYAQNVHIDTHSVLLGEIAFAPFNRLIFSGMDLGPESAYMMGSIFILSLVFISLFYKELKVSTFDETFASSMGFRPRLIHYLLMAIVSLTCVGAFDAVGSILVIALIVIPPCCAYLLTDSLFRMILLSVVFGVSTAISGFWVANWLDVNIAGSIASVCGVFFLGVFLLAPRRGLFGIMREKRKQRMNFAEASLLVSLYNQEEDKAVKNHPDSRGMFRSVDFASKVVEFLKQKGEIAVAGGKLFLTDKGRERARMTMERR
ncbi:MAG: metal ABC transporter permease [Candidatus Dadabacteria bacterium]|nr:metal ABC transporter permease [Candidatus Dadabacteria bacterium]